MPDYQYRCLNCQKRFEIYLSYDEYGSSPVNCPSCGSSNVERKIGRIIFARSEESRLEDLADPSALEGLEDDPRALGKMMRKMSSEMGEDLGPEYLPFEEPGVTHDKVSHQTDIELQNSRLRRQLGQQATE